MADRETCREIKCLAKDLQLEAGVGRGWGGVPDPAPPCMVLPLLPPQGPSTATSCVASGKEFATFLSLSSYKVNGAQDPKQ